MRFRVQAVFSGDRDPYVPEPLSPVIRAAIGSMMREQVLPWYADIDLEPLAALPGPTLVVSGGWSPAFAAVCDLLAQRLRAERAEFSGYLHMPQCVGGLFNERIERLWASASALSGA